MAAYSLDNHPFFARDGPNGGPSVQCPVIRVCGQKWVFLTPFQKSRGGSSRNAMVNVNYGTAEEVQMRDESKKGVNAVKISVAILAGLMAAAMVAASSAAMKETPAHYRSELVSYNKIMAKRSVSQQRRTMLHGDATDMADGVAEDQEDTGGYECCWKAPNAKLASTSVASQVGPNGWGSKTDDEASVNHYTNVLGAVPDWVFKGTADHDWKSYSDVADQQWYQNTYPAGESGI